MGIECHLEQCLLRPARTRRSPDDTPEWVTRMQTEDAFNGVLLQENGTVFDNHRIPMVVFEQPGQMGAPAREALRDWDGVPAEVQLGAWALCKHLLRDGHPDRHYGLTAWREYQ